MMKRMRLIIATALMAVLATGCFKKMVFDCEYTVRTLIQDEKGNKDYLPTYDATVIAFAGADVEEWYVESYEDAVQGVITSAVTGGKRSDFISTSGSDNEFGFNFTDERIMLVAYHKELKIFGYRDSGIVGNLESLNIPVIFQSWILGTESSPLRDIYEVEYSGWTMVYTGADTEPADPSDPEPPKADYVRTYPYTVLFEKSENPDANYPASGTYDTTVRYFGPEGFKWGLYNAAISTATPITGSQSLRLQWLAAADKSGFWPRASTNFTLEKLKKVTFNACYAYDAEELPSYMNLRVLHSTDKGKTWKDEQVYVLSTTPEAFTYEVGGTDGVDAMLRFTISIPDQRPENNVFVIVDDVQFDGMTTEQTD